MMTPAQPGRRSRRLPILLDPAELELRCWVQFARTFVRLQRKLEQELEKQGVSQAQFDVLATLKASEGVTQQELAEHLLVTKGNVCGLIDRMAAAGLVERRADPEDRRANRMYLTRRGKSLLAKAAPQQLALIEHAMRALDGNELQRFYQFLDRLDAGLDEPS